MFHKTPPFSYKTIIQSFISYFYIHLMIYKILQKENSASP
ncbi:hypothetical protein CLOLEP_02445 [[Clostridium] leptum DSM 753]|uniref:Uncharacterized protein n=1 Tax=[Clostridium] leptum DSM 753 TaxID=428125 RepID=A7VV41_9FIRM|nr:hypothetical protein CLOLEP_02445 [[Clostridium] leptum DSM 753]